MGDVIVAGVQTADETLHSGVISDIVIAGLDQTDFMADVQHQLLALLNTNNIAVLGVDGAVDHFDNLLGLAGALLAHDNSNHVYHSLRITDDKGNGVPLHGNTLPYRRSFFNCYVTNF